MYGHVMSNSRGRTRNVVALQTRREEAQVEVPEALSASPLYGVAMLKIAMELKKADARPVEELVAGVLNRMGLSEDQFHAFLEANGGLLRTIASKRKY